MDELEKTVVQHTEQIKTLFANQNQLQKLVDSVNSLAVSVEKLAMKQNTMSDEVTGLRTDVDAIKEKPAKKWEDITNKVIWAILAAVIGVVLGKFGL
jgi:outer membrane murein-binding lipoprotein Lpp